MCSFPAEHRLRQCISHDDIRCDDCNVLLPIPSAIRDRVGVSSPCELCDPQLFSGFDIECAEAAVVARGNEQYATGCHDWTRQYRTPGVLFPFGELLCDSQRNLPGDVSRRRIDGRQAAPWRFLARPVLIANPHVEGVLAWR